MITNLLFRDGRSISRSQRTKAVACSAVTGSAAGSGGSNSRRGTALGRQRLSRSTAMVGAAGAVMSSGRRDAVAPMAHGLGGQVAVVHALCAVLAGRAAILVDTLGLALATAHARAACSEGGGANCGGHGWDVGG